MRIRTIGVVSLIATFALLAGGDAAQAKSSRKHGGKSHCTQKLSVKKSPEKACTFSSCAKRGCKHAGSLLFKKGNCKTELELVTKAGLCNVVCGKGPHTFFCPTDAAYGKLGKARLDDIKNDPKKLANLIKYHVLPKKLMAADIQAKGSVITLEGESLMTNVKDGKPEVDGCLIIESDIPCSNGVIHLIDDVPVPERGK